MDTDICGYTMVRFNDAALTTDQNAYAAKCAAAGLEIIVARTENHAKAIYAWNGNEVANLYNVFPKFNGAQSIFNWEARCKGVPCSFWMTNNGNGDVACGGFEPNGDNNTAFRIYRCEHRLHPPGRLERRQQHHPIPRLGHLCGQRLRALNLA